MKLHIKHTTDYRYTEPLRYALQTLWLTPLSGPSQTVDFWSLGAPEELFAQADAFGNSIHSYTFVGELSDNVRWSLVNAAGTVETLGIAEFNDAPSMPLPQLYRRGLAEKSICKPYWPWPQAWQALSAIKKIVPASPPRRCRRSRPAPACARTRRM
jgi:transglutaminase-like putative cysteine protease